MTSGINLGTTSADWQMWQQEQLTTAKRKMNQNYTGYVSKTQETKQPEYVSEKNNTCTDGNDDGKIGFVSAAANVVEGIGKGLVNTVKNAVKHPFKTALMVGACCIPVVGPFIAGGLAVYGIAKGAYTIGTGVSKALQATTDAEAKDMWEQVGEGTFEAGVSALALKGAAGAMKSQLNGGSNTVNLIKEAKAGGKSTSEIAEIAVKEGIKETGSNAIDVVKTIKEKTYDKAKELYKDRHNLEAKARGKIDDVASKAGEITKKAGEKYENYKANNTKEVKAAKAEANAKTVEQIKKGTNGTVKENSNGSFEIIEKQNGNTTTIKYNKNGKAISGETVDASGKTISSTKYNSKGDLISETYEIDGTTYTSKYSYNKSGAKSAQNSQITKNADGKVINSSTTTVKGDIKQTKASTVTAEGNVSKSTVTTNTQTGERIVETRVSGKNISGANGKSHKTYFANGKQINNPTLTQKVQIEANTSNAGIKVNEIIDAESFEISTKFGKLTVKTPDELMYTAPLVTNED